MAWIGAEIHGHSPGNMRIRSSAIAIVSAFTAPPAPQEPALADRTHRLTKQGGGIDESAVGRLDDDMPGNRAQG